MNTGIRATALLALFVPAIGWTQAAPGVGTEEFGLSPRELVQAIEKSEALISKCMREKGFEYVAADVSTVRAGMHADKKVPGLNEEEFVRRYGYGVATMYTGRPPQLESGYSPAKVGLGERNIQYFKTLPPAAQAAYNLTLLGENINATLAVALETEDLSRTGGCTRKSVEQVFKPEQLKGTFYNPLDDLIRRDRRMKEAVARYAREMKKAGYAYNHPDDVEPDIRTRLAALTDGGRIPIEQMSPAQKEGLKKLQAYELAVAAKSVKMHEEILTPVEERIHQELYSRKVE